MKISFIGLGRMGRELVVHLIDAGHDVTVWNRSAPAAEEVGGAPKTDLALAIAIPLDLQASTPIARSIGMLEHPKTPLHMAIERPDTATTIETVSTTPPGRSAATKPSGTPIAIAKIMEANINCSVGHIRLASMVVTGSRVRNEVPKSPVASLAM